MSNATGPFGLRYVSGPRVVIPCYLAAGYATAMYKGDPVTLSPTTADREAAGTRTAIIKAVLTDTSIWFGVIEGFEPLVSDLSKQYNPASTARIAYVCLAGPETVFEIRGSGGGTAPTAGTVGLNASGHQGTASTVWGTSGVVLDEGDVEDPAADQTNPMLILSFKNVADNVVGSRAVYRVLLNTQYSTAGLRLGVAGA